MANIISSIKVPSIGTSVIRGAYMCYGETGGSGAAYTLSVTDHTGASIGLDSYQDGLTVVARFHTSQTSSTPTLNVNSLGARRIVTKEGDYMSGITAGSVWTLTYTTVNNVGAFVATNSDRPREVPVATVSDAGKFLTVGTTGAYTLETVPDAENTLY